MKVSCDLTVQDFGLVGSILCKQRAGRVPGHHCGLHDSTKSRIDAALFERPALFRFWM